MPSTPTDEQRRLMTSRLEVSMQKPFLLLRPGMAEALQNARTARDIPVNQAAKAIGVRADVIRSWELGSIPSLELLVVYCKILGTELSAILAQCGC